MLSTTGNLNFSSGPSGLALDDNTRPQRLFKITGGTNPYSAQEVYVDEDDGSRDDVGTSAVTTGSEQLWELNGVATVPVDTVVVGVPNTYGVGWIFDAEYRRYITAKTTDYAVLSYGIAADPDDPPRWLSNPSLQTIVGRTSVVCGVPSEILGNLFFYNATNSYYLLIKAATFSETQTMTLPSAAPTSTSMVLKNGSVTTGSYSTGWDFVDATEVTYTPTTSADWTGSDPTTVQQALDRIAAALGPIA